jgi:hypothetical protein
VQDELNDSIHVRSVTVIFRSKKRGDGLKILVWDGSGLADLQAPGARQPGRRSRTGSSSVTGAIRRLFENLDSVRSVAQQVNSRQLRRCQAVL